MDSAPHHLRRRWPVVGLLFLVAGAVLAADVGVLRLPAPLDRGVSDRARVATGAAITLVLTLGIFVLLRRQLSFAPLGDAGEPLPILGSEERLRRDAAWFVDLRWVAAAVALGLITCAERDSWGRLLPWWAGLVAANLGFEAWLQKWRAHEGLIVAQAAIDLVVLTGFLNASGGLENPLHTLFVFHVIVGRILLPGRRAFLVTLIAMALFGFMAFGEYSHLLPHHPNVFFPHFDPAVVGVVQHGCHQHVVGHAAYDPFFVLGRSVPFLAVLLLTDSFVASVMRRLRGSERSLEEAAQTARFERGRLEGVVDAAGVGMMQVDSEISLLWFSGRVSEWLGWDARQRGRICPLLGAPGGCETCVVRSTLATGRPAAAERRVPDGPRGERFFRHSASPIRDAAGAVVQAVEVIEDVTSRRALEAEAIRAGKLSVLGRMAAGIAHEIGNPLSSITTRLALLERRRDESFVAQSVSVLRQQIERISRIVHGVSHFARAQRKDRTAWEAAGLVEEMVGVTELDRRARGIRFELALEEPSPLVYAVRDQSGQILLNFLLNAVEAMPGGGTVRVGCAGAGGEVRLWVADEGTGIDEETLAHLFEPFYTTRREGTGLGLSISYGLAAAHGGRIEVESRQGEGARFVLVLPEHAADAAGGVPPEEGAVP